MSATISQVSCFSAVPDSLSCVERVACTDLYLFSCCVSFSMKVIEAQHCLGKMSKMFYPFGSEKVHVFIACVSKKGF